MKFEKGNIVKHRPGGNAMVQGQSQYAGEKEEDRKIWYTYHALALKAAREAIDQNPAVKAKVRSEKTDESLACVKNRLPPCFSKSLVAIIMCVFTIEYRVNRVAKDEGIWEKEINSYFDENGVEVPLCEPKEFNKLLFFQKWCSIVKVLGKTLKPEFRELVKKLKHWITLRNKIAHGDYKQILKFQISPKQARSCYNEITEAIFGLNTALGYGKKKENDSNCKNMLL